jgi:hypothetical protein
MQRSQVNRSCINLLYLTLFSINIFHPHIIPLCPNYQLCLFLKILQEVLSDLKWKEVIQEAMKALLKNNTWDLFELSEVKKGGYMQVGVYYKV